jgi:RecA/RadA recombinase
MNSEALRKLAIMTARQNVALVYTSQVRVKMDVANPYMDPYESSSGGKALQFYASTRVRLQKKSKQKQKIHGV